MQISDELTYTYGEFKCPKFLHLVLLETQDITQFRHHKTVLINPYLSWFNSERCEDLRTVNSQRFTQEAKRGQEFQIREREYIKKQERDVERIWAEVSKKQQEEKVIKLLFKQQ